MKMKSYLSPEYIIERDQDRCIRCKVCVNQCTYETHYYDCPCVGPHNAEDLGYEVMEINGKFYALPNP